MRVTCGCGSDTWNISVEFKSVEGGLMLLGSHICTECGKQEDIEV